MIMKQEDKELLLKDLCCRLPYGVKLQCKWKNPVPNGTYGMLVTMDSYILDQICNMDDIDYPFEDVKPYLFPLSSITEEQESDLNLYLRLDKEPIMKSIKEVDWFNKNHFDYRGLIEKGLAIDANSKIEELYEKGTYVSEYRNTWDLLTILNLSEDEKDNAVCYRIINDLPIYRLRICGAQTLEFLETYKSLDRDKFVYIIKCDW